MGRFFIVLGEHFVLGDGGFTTGAPGHSLVALINPAFLPANLKKVPDGVVIFVGHGEVGIVPVHEITESFALLCLDSGKFQNSLFTLIDEFGDTVGFDIFL